jgi:membrane protein
MANSAAALGYYFVFSLFPFLVFLATLTAFIPHVKASVDTLLARARFILPAEAMAIIEPHARGLVANSRPHLLTLGLAAALYSASRGVDAVRIALNRAYDVKESRPLWKTELLAFGVTIGGGLLLLAGIGVLLAGSSAGQWAARRLFIADEYVTVLVWIRWPVTTIAIMLGAAFTYYLLPDLKQRFRFITPGSSVGTLLWFLASWSFGRYVTHFGSYDITYGSLGGVIVLLTWLYITGFILLMGGEINAVIDDASSDGTQRRTNAPDR